MVRKRPRYRVVGGSALLIGVAVAGIAWILSAPTVSPSGTPPRPQSTVVRVEYGDIRSVVVLDGVAMPQEVVPITIDRAATVDGLSVRVGDSVTAGARLFRAKDDAGVVVTATSPVSGIVAQLPTEGLRLMAGGIAAGVRPEGFDAVATVDPARLYRFYARPSSVRVQLDHGPAPFDCPFVSIGVEATTGIGDALAAPVVLRCTIPSSVRVFAGVRLKMAAVTAEAKHVLALPVETVVGQADSGYVTIVTADGLHQRRDVKLGITDGFRVEILAGLAAGDAVLDPPEVDGSDAFATSPSGP